MTLRKGEEGLEDILMRWKKFVRMKQQKMVGEHIRENTQKKRSVSWPPNVFRRPLRLSLDTIRIDTTTHCIDKRDEEQLVQESRGL